MEEKKLSEEYPGLLGELVKVDLKYSAVLIKHGGSDPNFKEGEEEILFLDYEQIRKARERAAAASPEETQTFLRVFLKEITPE
jgi:hypothetical protein